MTLIDATPEKIDLLLSLKIKVCKPRGQSNVFILESIFKATICKLDVKLNKILRNLWL